MKKIERIKLETTYTPKIFFNLETKKIEGEAEIRINNYETKTIYLEGKLDD